MFLFKVWCIISYWLSPQAGLPMLFEETYKRLPGRAVWHQLVLITWDMATNRKLLSREHMFCRLWFVWYYNVRILYHPISDNHFRPNWLWSYMCQSRVPTTSGLSAIIHWYFWKTQVFGLSSLPNPYLERHPDEVAKKIQTKISGILWVPDGWLQGPIRLKSIEYIGDSLLVGGWPTPLKKIRVRQLGWLFHSQFRWKIIQSCSSHHQLDIICVSM